LHKKYRRRVLRFVQSPRTKATAEVAQEMLDNSQICTSPRTDAITENALCPSLGVGGNFAPEGRV
jgi:hypothetical protein